MNWQFAFVIPFWLAVFVISMMRGRTFKDAFIILDEAQNGTKAELRMLLTRLGRHSTMLLVGDASQSDLPPNTRGAFQEIIRRLAGMPELGIVLIAECERRLEEGADELQE